MSDASQALLEEMRESGELCCIDISSDYMYVWDIWIVRDPDHGGQGHVYEGSGFSYEDLDDAIADAHAIWKGTYKDSIVKRKRDTVWADPENSREQDPP